jgi:hypothetical protein
MTIRCEDLFWALAAELQKRDPRITEGTIMNGRCLRVGKEFLALVDYKGSGLVVKLPRERVTELIDAGIGKPSPLPAKCSGSGSRYPRPIGHFGGSSFERGSRSSASRAPTATRRDPEPVALRDPRVLAARLSLYRRDPRELTAFHEPGGGANGPSLWPGAHIAAPVLMRTIATAVVIGVLGLACGQNEPSEQQGSTQSKWLGIGCPRGEHADDGVCIKDPAPRDDRDQQRDDTQRQRAETGADVDQTAARKQAEQTPTEASGSAEVAASDGDTKGTDD